MLPEGAALAVLLPGCSHLLARGQRAASSQTASLGHQCWPRPSPGHPAASRQQAQALIALLWFLSFLFKNKTNKKKRGRRRALIASLQSRCVSPCLSAGHRAGTSRRGHARGLASRCLDMCFFSVS